MAKGALAIGAVAVGTLAIGALKPRYVRALFEKLPPCHVGIEACATSHYLARELQAFGHWVWLTPPAYQAQYAVR